MDKIVKSEFQRDPKYLLLKRVLDLLKNETQGMVKWLFPLYSTVLHVLRLLYELLIQKSFSIQGYKNSLGSIFLQMYKIHYNTFVPRAYFDTYMKFLLQLFKKS